MQLYLPDRYNMNTFPLSYLVRLLGYDANKLSKLLSIEANNIDQLLQNDDQDHYDGALKLHTLLWLDENELQKRDPWYTIPPQGIFRDAVYSKQQPPKNNRNELSIEGMPVSTIDPLYLKLLLTYEGNPNIIGNPSNEDSISSRRDGIKSIVTLKSAPQRLAQPKDANAVFFSFAKDFLSYLEALTSEQSTNTTPMVDNSLRLSEKRSNQTRRFDISKLTFRFGFAGKDEAYILYILGKTGCPSYIRSYYTESRLSNILFKGTKSVSDFVILCCDNENNGGENILFFIYSLNDFLSLHYGLVYCF